MRKVTCYQCGRSYDFDRDDFCPRCGSFTAPGDSSSTKLERDLLSRFDTGRQAPRYIPAGVGAAQNAGSRRHSSRIEDCRPCRAEQKAARQKKARGGGILVLLVVVAVLLLLSWLLPWLTAPVRLLLHLY